MQPGRCGVALCAVACGAAVGRERKRTVSPATCGSPRSTSCHEIMWCGITTTARSGNAMGANRMLVSVTLDSVILVHVRARARGKYPALLVSEGISASYHTPSQHCGRPQGTRSTRVHSCDAATYAVCSMNMLGLARGNQKPFHSFVTRLDVFFFFARRGTARCARRSEGAKSRCERR